MGRPIVHHDGYFFEWSTIVDAPRTYGMRREKFEAYYKKEYGRDGAKDLTERLERALKYGTSLHDGTSARDLISGNRAGDKETELSFDDLIRVYCLERPEGD